MSATGRGQEEPVLLGMSDLKRYTLAATDGEIGRVTDVYFDDDSWTVRYLVVDTGTWLPGRQVLISPLSIRGVEPLAEAIHVALSREQVKESPPIDTDRPVSRQHELDLSRHYGFAPYWTGPDRWGLLPYPALLDDQPEPIARADDETMAREAEGRDPHLRSLRQLVECSVQARDGTIGHVHDLLIDTRVWAIRYLVVDTRDWWPGKKVLLSPEWLSGIDTTGNALAVDLPRERIQSAPAYDPGTPVDRDLETRLHEHYGHPKYWETEHPGQGDR